MMGVKVIDSTPICGRYSSPRDSKSSLEWVFLSKKRSMGHGRTNHSDQRKSMPSAWTVDSRWRRKSCTRLPDMKESVTEMGEEKSLLFLQSVAFYFLSLLFFFFFMKVFKGSTIQDNLPSWKTTKGFSLSSYWKCPGEFTGGIHWAAVLVGRPGFTCLWRWTEECPSSMRPTVLPKAKRPP